MKFVVLASLITSVVSFHIPAPKAPVSKTALFAENGASASPKKIIVLGGDGFCGWPTSLYLSDRGHDVVIVDNLSRRKIDLDLGCDSLTPIQSPEVRVMAWRKTMPSSDAQVVVSLHCAIQELMGLFILFWNFVDSMPSVEGGFRQGNQICKPGCRQRV